MSEANVPSGSEPDDGYRDGEIFVGLTLLGLLVYGGGLAAWSARSVGAPPEPGPSLTDWIVALGAIAGFIAASWAAYSTWSTLKVERDRDRASAEDLKRGQANQVAVWASKHYEGMFVSASGHNEVTELTLQLRNASSLPVTNVKIALLFRTTADLDAPLLRFADVPTIPVLPPSEGSPITRSVPRAWSVALKDLTGLHTTPLNRLVIRLRFTDSAGIEWRRDTPGRLDRRDTYAPNSFWCRDLPQ